MAHTMLVVNLVEGIAHTFFRIEHIIRERIKGNVIQAVLGYLQEQVCLAKKEVVSMAAYFVVEVRVEDPQTYEEYRKLVAPTLERYGGKFLVRGGATETIEGDWQPQRLVILEFEDSEQFKRWYYSLEYTQAREIRFRASTGKAVLAQGI